MFSSICDNFFFVFFTPEIDNIAQYIYCYFISIRIYPVSQLLFNSLQNIMPTNHSNYKFNNYYNNQTHYLFKFIKILIPI